MKKALLLIPALLLSLSTYASTNSYYSCVLDESNDIDSWHLSIDLKAKALSFFDNDHHSVLKYKNTIEIETYPVQIEHTFKGKDSVYTNIVSHTVVFNETHKTATLSTVEGRKTETYYFNCKPVAKSDLIFPEDRI